MPRNGLFQARIMMGLYVFTIYKPKSPRLSWARLITEIKTLGFSGEYQLVLYITMSFTKTRAVLTQIILTSTRPYREYSAQPSNKIKFENSANAVLELNNHIDISCLAQM